jgi:uncharacterized protein YajQ (UPF0234 family)
MADSSFDIVSKIDRMELEAETEERAKAALEVLKEKMIKRGVSLKHLEIKEPEQSGKLFKIFCPIKEGISTENAKKITKLLKDEAPKSIKAQIQSNAVRVSGKSKDDLQSVIALIKTAKLDFAIQFTNYR